MRIPKAVGNLFPFCGRSREHLPVAPGRHSGPLPTPSCSPGTEAGRGQGTDTVPEFGKLWLGSVPQSPSLRGAWGCQVCCSIVLA